MRTNDSTLATPIDAAGVGTHGIRGERSANPQPHLRLASAGAPLPVIERRAVLVGDRRGAIAMTVEQIAAALQLPKKTAEQLCREGRMPGAMKFGRSWRIARAAFEAYLRQVMEGVHAGVSEGQGSVASRDLPARQAQRLSA